MPRIVLLMATVLIGIAGAEAPIYGYFWLRYTYDNPTTPDVDENAHYFSIERGYVRWKSKSAPVEFSGTVDIAQKADATNASDWNIRLKYAQADWTVPTVSDYLPDAKLTFGLQKVLFGTIDTWEYPLIEKALEDAEKKMNSADLGMSFSGYLPRGLGGFGAQIFNGNGYSSVVETNTNKALCGDLYVIPIPGVTIKGSIWWAESPSGDSIVTQVAANRYAGVLQVCRGPFTIMAELLSTLDDELTGLGYMGFVEYAVTRKVGLAARFDYWDKDTDAESNAHMRMMGGVNYAIADRLLMQLNYAQKMYEDEERDPVDQLAVQFKMSY